MLEHDLKIAKSLSDKGYELVLEGHADNAGGSTEYNMALSERVPKRLKLLQTAWRKGANQNIRFMVQNSV